jgi:hypothetical protein
MSHVKAPWRKYHDGTNWVVDCDDHPAMIDVWQRNDKSQLTDIEAEATAALVSASPEMLEALIMCTRSMMSLLPDFNPYDQAAYDKAMSAIAKATNNSLPA